MQTMTNDEGGNSSKNCGVVDNDCHENGDTVTDTEPPAKESDPLQPKMVKSKSLKEVKEVSHIVLHTVLFVISFSLNSSECFIVYS